MATAGGYIVEGFRPFLRSLLHWILFGLAALAALGLAAELLDMHGIVDLPEVFDPFNWQHYAAALVVTLPLTLFMGLRREAKDEA